ncbi:MAG: hypothetical protein IJY08_00880 [Clostridia bacterium]|nr:hypothetical protein [Clostridia bacterium]
MAKKYEWEVKEALEEGGEKTHTVSLVCSMLTGKAVITIDGDEFDISVKPFSLRDTNQVFRLGEEAAVIDFPKKGDPTVTVGGEVIAPTFSFAK